MASIIQQLKDKGLVSDKKISIEELFELDLNNPDDMLIFITERLLDELHRIMMAKGITRSDLAKKMGVSKQAISKSLTRKNVSIPWIIKAILVLGGMLDMNLFLPNQSIVSQVISYEQSPVIPISKRFEMLRKKMNVSVKNLAEKAAVKVHDIEEMELGKKLPDMNVIKKLARALHVPLSYLCA